MAFGNRSGERQTETDDGDGALASERADKSALGSHVESVGLEHLSGGAGVKSLVFGHFRRGNHLGRYQNNHRAFGSS